MGGDAARIEIPPMQEHFAQRIQAGISLPELIVFERQDFNINAVGEEEGDSWRTTLNYAYVGNEWRNEISSLIILSGVWEFYGDPDYHSTGWPPVRLGPGHYPRLEQVGIPDNAINSFQAIQEEPEMLLKGSDCNSGST